jgi:spermidine/putrescine transport system permease protein
MLIVFALSIDDFVVTQYMSAGADTTTIPMYLYANARGGSTTPAINALATIMVIVTLIGVGAAFGILRLFAKRTEPSGKGGAMSLAGVGT